MGPRVVTLVPWRSNGDDRRQWNWDVTRPYLEALGYPIFEGAPYGPEWARAEALNDAAAKAGDWDVAVMADTDTIPEVGAVRRAVAWVLDTGGAARPHLDRYLLTRAGSNVLAKRGPYAVPLDPVHLDHCWPGGGLLVIVRSAYDAVGGYDETFRGWGFEDSAMNLALLAGPGWDRLPGRAWHLWHVPENDTVRRESVQRHAANLKASERLIEEWGSNQALRLLKEVF